jgi:hypothetical protein
MAASHLEIGSESTHLQAIFSTSGGAARNAGFLFECLLSPNWIDAYQ